MVSGETTVCFLEMEGSFGPESPVQKGCAPPPFPSSFWLQLFEGEKGHFSGLGDFISRPRIRGLDPAICFHFHSAALWCWALSASCRTVGLCEWKVGGWVVQEEAPPPFRGNERVPIQAGILFKKPDWFRPPISAGAILKCLR
uniref:Uncharacterized protein n=1 Tax=Sphaerodactylus townsendi TaxID=933632 RepID=A0ACB8FJE1_9SAUR